MLTLQFLANLLKYIVWLAFVKGSVLVWVTDKYSEREARASSVEFKT